MTSTRIKNHAEDVAILHKPGYGKVVWRKIVEAELDYLQITFSKNNIVPVKFAGKTIRNFGKSKVHISGVRAPKKMSLSHTDQKAHKTML